MTYLTPTEFEYFIKLDVPEQEIYLIRKEARQFLQSNESDSERLDPAGIDDKGSVPISAIPEFNAIERTKEIDHGQEMMPIIKIDQENLIHEKLDRIPSSVRDGISFMEKNESQVNSRPVSRNVLGLKTRVSTCTFEVLVGAYIPEKYIDDPSDIGLISWYEFEGDDRGPASSSAETQTKSRVWMKYKIDFCNQQQLFSYGIGTTRRVKLEYARSSYYGIPIVRPSIVKREEARASGAHTTGNAVFPNNCKVEIHMESAESNPFISLAPAIDIVFDMNAWLSDGTIYWNFTMKHDGFPNYEVWISGGDDWVQQAPQAVYSFDHVAHGQVPLSLLPDAEWTKEMSGTISNLVCNCCPTKNE
ncbi:MAG: DUF3238 domain-containing protein [Planctomycetes bacterium]|nr:DUF3238 domain-containing protein [Planctomycetota bacterium]MCR4318240.1 DUF3238 domain-containing protein [Planctomycetota bacterium]